MKCRNCGKRIDENLNFCKYCGAPVKMRNENREPERKCKNCGTVIKAGESFCRQCGTPVDSGSVKDNPDNGPIRKKEPEKKKGGLWKVLIAVLSVAVIVVMGILVVRLLDVKGLVERFEEKKQKENQETVISATGNSAREDGVTGSENAGDQKTKDADTKNDSQPEPEPQPQPTPEPEPQPQPEPQPEPTPQPEPEPEPEPAPEPQPTPQPEPEPAPEPEPEPEEEHTLPFSQPDNYYVKNGHTYAFYNAARLGLNSYSEVADFCRDQGGHLAVINNTKENTYLFDLLRNNYSKTAFFGYSDEDSEGDWEWSDEYSDYENWTDYGEWDLPDNGKNYGGDEDYAEFNYERGKDWVPNDGTWNDAPFRDNTDLFICEWEFDVVKAME